VTVANRSVVFLGDPASATVGGANENATHQSCQISSSQLLYLSVYEGECSQGEFPGHSIPQLLTCAQDSNKVIKLMQVKVDGMDVSSNIVHESTSQPYVYTIRSSDNAYNLKLPTSDGRKLSAVVQAVTNRTSYDNSRGDTFSVTESTGRT
jgi:hypothetical protein